MKDPISAGSTISLAPCPTTPNCVSSDATDERHRVAPFRLKMSPEDAWQEVCNAVGEMKGS